MKFIVTSDVLYRNLSAVSGVMSSNNSMSILDNVLVTIKDSKMTLTASDLESTMTAVIELDNVEGEGSVSIVASQDARKIYLDISDTGRGMSPSVQV